jgi:hypothetical protein
LDIVVDVKKAQDKFRAAKDQIPLALSHTFNRLVYEIAVGDGGSGVLRKETDRKLDKGAERFTLSGFQYRKSTKKDLVAEAVADFTGGRLAPDGIYKTGGGSERKREYLRTILNGGTVKPVGTRQTLIEPITKNIKLNKHGNLLPSKFNKLRAQAADAKRLAPGGRDQILAGSKTKPKLKIATKGKKKGQAVGKASQYFWGTPRNKPKNDKNYGLWERMNRSQKNPYGTGVKKIIMAGRKSRQQKRMVQGREISHKHFMRNYNRQFLKSFAMAMRTSHQRSRVIDSFNERRKS